VTPATRPHHGLDIATLLGAAILFVIGLTYVTTREHAPIVNVRWSATVDADQRTNLRRQYELLRCTASGERTDTCELLDTGRANLAAIVGDRLIEDTYHINRTAFTISADADRAGHVTWILHRTPLARVRGALNTILAIALGLAMAGPISRLRARAHLEGRPLITFNVWLAALALGIYAVLVWTTGRIDVEGGLGFDGRAYAAMLEQGLTVGTRFTLMRPLIVVLARIPYYFTQEVIASFAILNYVCAFLQAYLVTKLSDRYGIDRFAKTYLVVSLALGIATARMFAYYPVLVDLGGYVALTLATYAVLAAPRPVALVATCAAVAAREFGIAVAFFGIHRAIRNREGLPGIATYVPAILVFVLLRWFASGAEQGLSIVAILLQNLSHWRESWYVASFVYFLLTTFGGISLILAARPQDSIRLLTDEPEWATFGATILGITLVFGIDVWRYLAFALPVVVVLFASASGRWTTREQLWLFSIGGVATWYTQRPFQHVDLATYFRDWFPYYVAYLGNTPLRTADLWPVWGWRLGVSAVLFVLLAISSLLRPLRHGAAEVALSQTI
jgi:hypothetical protein